MCDMISSVHAVEHLLDVCLYNLNIDEVKDMELPLQLTSTDVSFPGLGINNLPIDRVAFTIGSYPIYWYGICIILAFGACVGLAMWQAKKFHFTSDDVIDVSLVIIPAAIIGARLYYVAFSWKDFSSDLMSIFDVRNGGLAVLGGVLLSIIAAFILTKVKKQNAARLFDFLIVYIPLGQAIGRWGNFFNQEAFGTNTTLPWGMISNETSAYLSLYCPTLNPDQPVHPTFLYESIACLLIFAVLLFVRKKIKLPLAPVAMYFILYGAARFFIEGLRTDSLYIGDTGLRSSQVLSAVLVVIGFGIIAFSRYRSTKTAGAGEADEADLPADTSENDVHEGHNESMKDDSRDTEMKDASENGASGSTEPSQESESSEPGEESNS